MKLRFRAVLWTALLVLLGLPLAAQVVTGSLTATIQDQAGAVIPNAEATLTNQATGASIPSRSKEAGIVLYPSLAPGVYTLKITAPGFRTYQVRDISVTANERRSLGTITLQLGQVQETVNVEAEVTPVQTASSERSGLIAGDQILNIAIKGRDFLGLLSTLPGVIDTNVGSREVVMTGNILNGLHVNGGRTTSIMYALDGI